VEEIKKTCAKEGTRNREGEQKEGTIIRLENVNDYPRILGKGEAAQQTGEFDYNKLTKGCHLFLYSRTKTWDLCLGQRKKDKGELMVVGWGRTIPEI